MRLHFQPHHGPVYFQHADQAVSSERQDWGLTVRCKVCSQRPSLSLLVSQEWWLECQRKGLYGKDPRDYHAQVGDGMVLQSTEQQVEVVTQAFPICDGQEHQECIQTVFGAAVSGSYLF